MFWIKEIHYWFFPEGTRSVDGKLGDGKKRIGLLLAKSQVKVVPARVIGGGQILERECFFLESEKINNQIRKTF